MLASDIKKGGLYLDKRSQIVKVLSASATKVGTRAHPKSVVAVFYVTGEGSRAGGYGVKDPASLSLLPAEIAGAPAPA